MVQRRYVECPTCGKLYQIKIQIDQNIGIFEWPICFECQSCGELLDYRFSSKGIKPRESNFHPTLDDSPITTIGYSSSLPITDELYLKDLNYLESMALSSPYINLTSHGHFLLEEISSFDTFLQRMQEHLLPYRGVLKALFPIWKKGNVSAFSKKYADLIGNKKVVQIDTPQGMQDAYFDLLERFYYYLITPRYAENCYIKHVKPLRDYLEKATSDEVNQIKTKLDESGKISLWYKDKAMPYIVDLLNDVQKLIPAMIFSSVGESDIKKRGDLKVVTISFDNALDKYEEGYEIYANGMKIFAGLNNILENGDIDSFSNPQIGNVDGVTGFASLPVGKMVEHVANYMTVNDYLDGAMNNKVRNASIHNNISYDATTQDVQCHYNPTDSSKVYDTSLMEICRLCYLLLLHITEAVLLARKIVEKGR